MGKVALSKLVTTRQYSELEEQAKECIKSDDWNGFMRRIQQASSKTRDAIVNLLELEAVGGTDSDVFKEFSSLDGTTLQEIRTAARDHAVNILEEQIEKRHTFFLDVDAMASSPYAVLVKDVIEARHLELTKLEGTPSRIDVLGTFYGFTILMIEGSKQLDTSSSQGYRHWRRRTWLEENLSPNAVNAVKQLTGEFGDAIDMDISYKTLGSSRVFKKRCTKTTADILADSVRLTMYKAPGNRITAARKLGQYEDSRALPFLHRRFLAEQSRNVRICIAESLGKVGHVSSIDILNERTNLSGRYLTKESMAVVKAMGKIYSPRCRATLTKLLSHGGNIVRATAIHALTMQDPSNMIDTISPHLKDKSKPVVRATVQALMNLGSKGETEIKRQSLTIIRKLVSDKTATPLLIKLFREYRLGEMKSVQQYFSERIERLGMAVKKIQKQIERQSSSSYYYRRRESRATRVLQSFLETTVTYLKPPFLDSLLTNIHEIPLISTGSYGNPRIPSQSALAKALNKRRRSV